MDDAVDEETLAGAQLRCSADQVRTGLADRAADYDRRRSGLTLRRVGEGWRSTPGTSTRRSSSGT